MVWKPGWVKTPAAERRAAEDAIAARPRWVVDGVSRRLGQAADAVVFLDVPRRVCALRCARRSLPYLFRSRPGLPPGCPELRILPTLARILWRFPRDVRPGILEDFEAWAGTKTLAHVQEEGETEALVARLTRPRGPAAPAPASSTPGTPAARPGGCGPRPRSAG